MNSCHGFFSFGPDSWSFPRSKNSQINVARLAPCPASCVSVTVCLKISAPSASCLKMSAPSASKRHPLVPQNVSPSCFVNTLEALHSWVGSSGTKLRSACVRKDTICCGNVSRKYSVCVISVTCDKKWLVVFVTQTEGLYQDPGRNWCMAGVTGIVTLPNIVKILRFISTLKR